MSHSDRDDFENPPLGKGGSGDDPFDDLFSENADEGDSAMKESDDPFAPLKGSSEEPSLDDFLSGFGAGDSEAVSGGQGEEGRSLDDILGGEETSGIEDDTLTSLGKLTESESGDLSFDNSLDDFADFSSSSAAETEGGSLDSEMPADDLSFDNDFGSSDPFPGAGALSGELSLDTDFSSSDSLSGDLGLDNNFMPSSAEESVLPPSDEAGVPAEFGDGVDLTKPEQGSLSDELPSADDVLPLESDSLADDLGLDNDFMPSSGEESVLPPSDEAGVPAEFGDGVDLTKPEQGSLSDELPSADDVLPLESDSLADDLGLDNDFMPSSGEESVLPPSEEPEMPAESSDGVDLTKREPDSSPGDADSSVGVSLEKNPTPSPFEEAETPADSGDGVDLTKREPDSSSGDADSSVGISLEKKTALPPFEEAETPAESGDSADLTKQGNDQDFPFGDELNELLNGGADSDAGMPVVEESTTAFFGTLEKTEAPFSTEPESLDNLFGNDSGTEFPGADFSDFNGENSFPDESGTDGSNIFPPDDTGEESGFPEIESSADTGEIEDSEAESAGVKAPKRKKRSKGRKPERNKQAKLKAPKDGAKRLISVARFFCIADLIAGNAYGFWNMFGHPGAGSFNFPFFMIAFNVFAVILLIVPSLMAAKRKRFLKNFAEHTGETVTEKCGIDVYDTMLAVSVSCLILACQVVTFALAKYL